MDTKQVLYTLLAARPLLPFEYQPLDAREESTEILKTISKLYNALFCSSKLHFVGFLIKLFYSNVKSLKSLASVARTLEMTVKIRDTGIEKLKII